MSSPPARLLVGASSFRAAEVALRRLAVPPSRWAYLAAPASARGCYGWYVLLLPGWLGATRGLGLRVWTPEARLELEHLITRLALRVVTADDVGRVATELRLGHVARRPSRFPARPAGGRAE